MQTITLAVADAVYGDDEDDDDGDDDNNNNIGWGACANRLGPKCRRLRLLKTAFVHRRGTPRS